MKKRLIMVGGWNDIYQKAKNCGFHLTVVQRKEDIKFEDMKIVDQFITSALSDKLVPDLVATIHKKYPFDAVVSFQELGVLNAALIGEKLSLSSNSLRPVLLTRDKLKMREHMIARGIPSIPFSRVNSSSEAENFGERHGWPIILKPSNGVGSIQVHKIENPTQARNAFDAITSNGLVADVVKHDFPDVALIAEKFIDGPEVSVEAVSWGGVHNILMVTDKITTGAPGFVETGHTMPSALRESDIAAIKQLTDTFLTSIDHLHGPSHTEVILSPDGPIIVESHTRTGGDRIFEMTELVCGVDMIKATLEGLFGAFPVLTPKTNGAAAIRFLELRQGKITAINGIDEARALEGVIRCELNVGVGDLTGASTHSAERPGYILATGANYKSAAEKVAQALELITLNLEDFDE